MPSAKMLMMVPEMIWSARTVIDSQACSRETRTPVPSPARSPTSSGSVIPIGPLASGRKPVAMEATYQAENALASIMPSMPMLTTPLRSFMKPHRAPRPMGVASVMIRPPLRIITSTR